MDDASQDSSFDIANGFREKDARFRPFLRSGPFKGANVCRNQGLAVSLGEYIVFLDSDDLMSSTCLEHRVLAMDAKPDCDFGVYQTELFNKSIGDRRVLWNNYTERNDLMRFLSLDGAWLTTGPIWRKGALAQLGGFDEQIISFQDWDIHIRALIFGLKYYKMPIRDNFHRDNLYTHNAISSVSCVSEVHLLSHERLFKKLHDQLIAFGFKDNATANHMVGLFWWLAECWMSLGDVLSAERVWRLPFDRGLCSRSQHFEGNLIIRFLSVRHDGKFARLIKRSWPSAYHQLSSRRVNNSPVGITEPPEIAVTLQD